MPNLTFLEIEPDSLTFKPDKLFKKKLNLKKLRILNVFAYEVTNASSVFEFFVMNLPENILTEFSARFHERDYDNVKCKEFFRYFCSTQRLIKKLNILFWDYFQYIVDGIKFLTLDELTLHGGEEVTKMIIKSQKNLKKLTFSFMELYESDFEEISKLPKLEFLKIEDELNEYNNYTAKSFELLGNSKSLKELSIEVSIENFYPNFAALKLDSLEILHAELYATADFIQNVSENFPNLKVLKAGSNQKLNLFAKFFPKLEKLSTTFNNTLWFCEMDTGIRHDNLRELDVEIYEYRTNFKVDANLSAILAIYPKLEVFKFHGSSLLLKSSENFFTEKSNIKNFKLSNVPVIECLKVLESMKSFAKKGKIFELSLSFRHDELKERETSEKIKESFRNQFKVVNESINEYYKMSYYKIVKKTEL